jgi:hypothetical protein
MKEEGNSTGSLKAASSSAPVVEGLVLQSIQPFTFFKLPKQHTYLGTK